MNDDEDEENRMTFDEKGKFIPVKVKKKYIYIYKFIHPIKKILNIKELKSSKPASSDDHPKLQKSQTGNGQTSSTVKEPAKAESAEKESDGSANKTNSSQKPTKSTVEQQQTLAATTLTQTVSKEDELVNKLDNVSLNTNNNNNSNSSSSTSKTDSKETVVASNTSEDLLNLKLKLQQKQMQLNEENLSKLAGQMPSLNDVSRFFC